MKYFIIINIQYTFTSKSSFEMMNILIVLLGCHIPFLLNDRIMTAIQFADMDIQTHTNINWFLSGGIKNPSTSDITEAEKMAEQIMEYQYTSTKSKSWNYIYDISATNTAENFIMVQQYLNESFVEYEEIYIVTSDFHYQRAKAIAEKIIQRKLNWILSPNEVNDSRYWENIHMRNVDADVQNAMKNIRGTFA